jgi:uncharacterized protein YukE
MQQRFSVHPESLIRAGSQFSVESARLADALARLESKLGALGDVCGNDDQGREFAKGYAPNKALLQHALSNMVEGLDAIGRGLEVMGINYAGGDAASRVAKAP